MLATVFSIFLLALLMFAGLFLIPGWMTKRATVDVVGRFCSLNALRKQDARTREELGLNPPSFVDRMTKARDYKPYAVQALKSVNVIRTTEEGKMYMAEEKLHPDYRCEKEDRRAA